jgi:putative glutamine amidotransferase
VSAEGLADCLLPLATAQDGTIEACQHRSLPWYGIMWHPEREEHFQTQDLTFMRKLFYG